MNNKVRVVFFLTGNEHRNGQVNGNTIKEATGASGTDQTTIMVAEYLASLQHYDVTIASPNGGHPGSVINGVTYTNLQFMNVVDNVYDILINTLWFEDFQSLPIIINHAIISWCHCPYLYGFDKIKQMITTHSLKYGIVHLSQWCKNLNTCLAHALDPLVFEDVIPNPIMTDVVTQVWEEIDNGQIQRNERDFVFHAEWRRGGDLAVKVLDQLGWHDSKIYACDYLMRRPMSSQVCALGAIGKRQVFEYIAKCGYFLYPLVSPECEMHKDTFACVVAEACAMGAIVVTYPVAALPETYNDCCIWLDFPPDVSNPEHLVTQPLSHDPALNKVEHIIETIQKVDSNPTLKENIRTKAKEFVLSKYNIQVIGRKWDEYLKRVMGNIATTN